ncbi:hypothetical protein ATANTOWER_013360 [Ataeniobius toweri]|uniref:Uncharacterized protein n=1 Tax=Ataeniobius toweri TaxID=208326 RepID=A0ABU7B4E9_9TELE|nr:hypothetical protein [Ataeniobius toweri]
MFSSVLSDRLRKSDQIMAHSACFVRFYCVLAVGSDHSRSQKPPKIMSPVSPLQPSNLFISFRPEGLSCHSNIKRVCLWASASAECRIMFPSERKPCHRCVTRQ